jgi:hypothetical protein
MVPCKNGLAIHNCKRDNAWPLDTDSASSGGVPEYLDLENPADLAKLQDAGGYLRSRRGRLVIIDEVQRAPGLFHPSRREDGI